MWYIRNRFNIDAKFERETHQYRPLLFQVRDLKASVTRKQYGQSVRALLELFILMVLYEKEQIFPPDHLVEFLISRLQQLMAFQYTFEEIKNKLKDKLSTFFQLEQKPQHTGCKKQGYQNEETVKAQYHQGQVYNHNQPSQDLNQTTLMEAELADEKTKLLRETKKTK